jgi:branched-chain amino acid transport system permease protein
MNRLLLAGAIVLLALLPLGVGGFYIDLATQILIFAILALTIDLLAGHAGRVPLGHAAIFGTATYVAAYSIVTAGMPILPACLLGVAGATVTAAIFALLAVRTTGVYFLLLTLAEGMIVFGIAFRWSSVTGAENGLRGIPRPPLFAAQGAFYYLVLAAFLVVLFAIHRVLRSPFGAALRGIRESASRMAMLGYNVPLHVFLAFTLSGFFAGIGGALYALYNGFVSPATVSLTQSTEGLLMVIIGGSGRLLGPPVGAALLKLLENYVSLYTDRWPMVLGALFVVAMLVARDGVLGALARWATLRGGAISATLPQGAGKEGKA